MSKSFGSISFPRIPILECPRRQMGPLAWVGTVYGAVSEKETKANQRKRIR